MLLKVIFVPKVAYVSEKSKRIDGKSAKHRNICMTTGCARGTTTGVRNCRVLVRAAKWLKLLWNSSSKISALGNEIKVYSSLKAALEFLKYRRPQSDMPTSYQFWQFLKNSSDHLQLLFPYRLIAAFLKFIL